MKTENTENLLVWSNFENKLIPLEEATNRFLHLMKESIKLSSIEYVEKPIEGIVKDQIIEAGNDQLAKLGASELQVVHVETVGGVMKFKVIIRK